MSVFISHKQEDHLKAKEIYNYLESKYITCYLDVMDKSTLSANDITNHITSRIQECTHLIAILSEKTKKSWWVPFEIGEATFGDRRISSYNIGLYSFEIPDYLKKWPIMKTREHLQLFVNEYKQDIGYLTMKKSAELLESTGAFKKDTRSADLFHNNLKKSIRGY